MSFPSRCAYPCHIRGAACISATIALIYLIIFGLGYPAAAGAAASARKGEGETVERIIVSINKSRTIRTNRPVSSVVLGSPEIADARSLTGHLLYILGKEPGTTNLMLFDADMKLIAVMDIEVTHDVIAIQRHIADMGYAGIKVSAANGKVILSGVAPSAVAAEQALSIAQNIIGENSSSQGGSNQSGSAQGGPAQGGSAQGGSSQGGQSNATQATRPTNVVNAIKIAPSQQVMLKVRFLEVDRSAARDIGVSWFGSNGSGTRGGQSGLGTPTVGNVAGVPLFGAAQSLLSGGTPFGVALASLLNNGNKIDVMLTALETKGLVRRLAEPDLVALSGDTAAFRAGGEFPVPVIQPGSAGGTQSTVTIQFKPFGVQLTFSPTVLSNGIINLRLAPSVSELDYANSVQIGGTQIPSTINRDARTTIELRDGQSFAIAGLLQSQDRRNISQLPWMGSVPVLGALFRSNDYQKAETDLVVIVTPHLVAPATPGTRLASPLDSANTTNDVDFFLFGQMEKRRDLENPTSNGARSGGPGHLLRLPN